MERVESGHPSINYILQKFWRLVEVFLNRYFRIYDFFYVKLEEISKNKIGVSIFILCNRKYTYGSFFKFVYCIDINQKSKETHTCTLYCEFAPSGSRIIVGGKFFSASESIPVGSPSAKTSIGLLYRSAKQAREKILPYLQRIDGEKCLLDYIIDLVRGLNQKVSDLNQKFRDLNQKLGYTHYFVYLVNRIEYDGYTGKTFVGIKIGEILAFIPVNFSIYAANIGGKISYHTILTIDGTHVYLMPAPKFMYSPKDVKSLSQENSAIEVLPLPVETGRSAFYSFSDTNLDALLEKASQTLIKFIDKLQEEIEKGCTINIYANPINLVYALMSGLVEIGKAFAIRREAKFNFSFAQDPNSLNFLGKVEVYTEPINPLIRIDLNAEVKNNVRAEIIINRLYGTIKSRETYDVRDEETLKAMLKDVARRLWRLQ